MLVNFPLSFRYCSEERRDKPFYESKNHFESDEFVAWNRDGRSFNSRPAGRNEVVVELIDGVVSRGGCVSAWTREPVVVLMFVALL